MVADVFDVFLPAIASAIAIWAIAAYPITEEYPHDVRVTLERGRGAPGDAVPAA